MKYDEAQKTLHQIHQLLTWEENWNSYQVPVTNFPTIARAKRWLAVFWLTIEDLPWLVPAVALGDNGEVTLEWWKEDRKLTLYISEEEVHYLQVWGTEANAKITEGTNPSCGECRLLWQWLLQEEAPR